MMGSRSEQSYHWSPSQSDPVPPFWQAFFPCSELAVQASLNHDQTVQCSSATTVTLIVMHANIRTDFTLHPPVLMDKIFNTSKHKNLQVRPMLQNRNQ
jgi:hypothetical protein